MFCLISKQGLLSSIKITEPELNFDDSKKKKKKKKTGLAMEYNYCFKPCHEEICLVWCADR